MWWQRDRGMLAFREKDGTEALYVGGVTSGSMYHQLPEFARDHTVVAVDLRGYNLSSKPDEFDDEDVFDVEGFKHTVEVVFTAQEILVGNADYPTERIGETSRAFRQLGIGYANLERWSERLLGDG